MRHFVGLSRLFLFIAAFGAATLNAQDQDPSKSDTTTVDSPGTTAVHPGSGDGEHDWLEPYREAAAKRWEKSIVALEALDATESTSADAILFIGSSSIRRWEDIATDMSPYRTIRRGYGGAKYSDVAIFAKRLIQPHQYRGLVIFVGNDVTGKETDRTPDELEQLVEYVVGISHAHRPGTPVFLVEVTPTESRYEAWKKIRAANARLREIALRTPDTYFIATAEHYLTPDGTPRSELFVEDRLHLNEKGYDLWSRLIRRRLDEVFRLMDETEVSTE